MREQAARMSRLIHDLLSLSQIEMREHDHPADPVALAPLLRDTAAALEPQAQARNMWIDLQLVDSSPQALGDRQSGVEGKRVAARVALGGRRLIQNHNNNDQTT